MNNVVRFEKSPVPIFHCTTPENVEYVFEYKPSLQKMWSDINPHDFTVELLINPYLDHENDVFALKDANSQLSIGYIFPISILDSEADFSDYRQLYNYIYVAFFILLERLTTFKSDKVFSDNFESNIIVCVFHSSVKTDSPLAKCIHSLRYYGYSYFVDSNTYLKAPGYDKKYYLGNSIKNISVKFYEPSLYKESMVDNLLRELPPINNIPHRFIILYQFIEFLMEKEANRSISTIISKYSCGNIPHNDFINDVKNLSTEINKINSIFDQCNITSTDTKDFRDKFDILCKSIGYVPDKTDPASLLYAFRNQMTHSYRSIHKFQTELAETVQAFERIILVIIERFN